MWIGRAEHDFIDSVRVARHVYTRVRGHPSSLSTTTLTDLSGKLHHHDLTRLTWAGSARHQNVEKRETLPLGSG